LLFLAAFVSLYQHVDLVNHLFNWQSHFVDRLT
jgi:hypothetical protein